MAHEYCQKCLTQLRIVGSGSTFCPRCQRTFHPDDPEHIAKEYELRTVDVIPAEAVVTPGTGIQEAGTFPLLDYACDNCGGPMASKCGSVCPGCNWVKPCDTGL